MQCQYKMTQYNSLNVKVSNSPVNKLKSRIKNGTEITLNLSSNMVAGSYPSSFTNGHFWTKIEFSNVVNCVLRVSWGV